MNSPGRNDMDTAMQGFHCTLNFRNCFLKGPFSHGIDILMRQDMNRLLLSFRWWQVLWKRKIRWLARKQQGRKLWRKLKKKNDQRVRRTFWEGEIWAEIWNARRSQSREDSKVRHSKLSALGSGWVFSGLGKLKEGQSGKSVGMKGTVMKNSDRQAATRPHKAVVLNSGCQDAISSTASRKYSCWRSSSFHSASVGLRKAGPSECFNTFQVIQKLKQGWQPLRYRVADPSTRSELILNAGEALKGLGKGVAWSDYLLELMFCETCTVGRMTAEKRVLAENPLDNDGTGKQDAHREEDRSS